jgi:hypothetical protein
MKDDTSSIIAHNKCHENLYYLVHSRPFPFMVLQILHESNLHPLTPYQGIWISWLTKHD